MAFEEITISAQRGTDDISLTLTPGDGKIAPLDDLSSSLKVPPPLAAASDGDCSSGATDGGTMSDSGKTVLRSGSGEGKGKKEKKDRGKKDRQRARSDETEGSGRVDVESQKLEARQKRKDKKKKKKRSGVRTKYLLESLRSELEELQRENAELRRIVVERLPVKADAIFQQCRPETLTPSSEEEDEGGDGGWGEGGRGEAVTGTAVASAVAEGEESGDENLGAVDEWAEILSKQLWIAD